MDGHKVTQADRLGRYEMRSSDVRGAEHASGCPIVLTGDKRQLVVPCQWQWYGSDKLEMPAPMILQLRERSITLTPGFMAQIASNRT